MLYRHRLRKANRTKVKRYEERAAVVDFKNFQKLWVDYLMPNQMLDIGICPAVTLSPVLVSK